VKRLREINILDVTPQTYIDVTRLGKQRPQLDMPQWT
jgi:hypothetical protein